MSMAAVSHLNSRGEEYHTYQEEGHPYPNALKDGKPVSSPGLRRSFFSQGKKANTFSET